MRTYVALGFGWFCGAMSSIWLWWPWTLIVAPIAGALFAIAEVLYDRRIAPHAVRR
jgi:hypothetical protein